MFVEEAFETVEYALAFRERLVGLLGRDDVPAGYALAFPNCDGVHTFMMKCPIDVICLDTAFGVLAVETVPPWKTGPHPKGTRHVVECRAGEAARVGIEPGGKLYFGTRALWRIPQWWREPGASAHP